MVLARRLMTWDDVGSILTSGWWGYNLLKNCAEAMAEIAFYHLQMTSLENILPVLLRKTLDAGKRAVVRAGSEDRLEALNSELWTGDPGGWLPHGSAKDGHAEEQPIWLTLGLDNPNGATFLFLTDGAVAGPLDWVERCFDLFDGNDDTALQAARARWSTLKEAGHDLTYWQQSDAGKWEERARS